MVIIISCASAPTSNRPVGLGKYLGDGISGGGVEHDNNAKTDKPINNNLFMTPIIIYSALVLLMSYIISVYLCGSIISSTFTYIFLF